MRYAAIDIGSNALRLLIADIIVMQGEIGFKKNTLIRVPVRLGDDAFLNKEISGRKKEDIINTMQAFALLLEVYKVNDYMACATSALREAVNGPELIKQIKSQAGITMEIITGKKEASIIYSTHAEQAMDKKKNYLYIDVGGGSTELSLFANNKLVASNSFDIGTIRMLDNRDLGSEWKRLKQWVKDNSKGIKNPVGIGTGGNINKLCRLAGNKEGVPVSFQQLKSLYAMLSSYSLKNRIQVLGLKQDRADVIVPAAEIYLTILKWAGIKQIHVPRVGLGDGIINLLIEKNRKEITI